MPGKYARENLLPCTRFRVGLRASTDRRISSGRRLNGRGVVSRRNGCESTASVFSWVPAWSSARVIALARATFGVAAFDRASFAFATFAFAGFAFAAFAFFAGVATAFRFAVAPPCVRRALSLSSLRIECLLFAISPLLASRFQ